MVEYVDQIRRSLIKRLPLIVGAAAFAPILLAESYDFNRSKEVKYDKQKPMTIEQIRGKVGASFPDDLIIDYTAPENNKGLEGYFRLIKERTGLVKLLLRIKDKDENQNRLIELSESIINGVRIYTESEFDFKKNTCTYNNVDCGVEVNTVPSIIRDLLNKTLEPPYIVPLEFRGQMSESKMYKIGLEEHLDKRGNLVVVGNLPVLEQEKLEHPLEQKESENNEISGSKVKRVEVLFRACGSQQIPVAIDIDYQINNIPVRVPFLKIDTGIRVSRDVTLRGVLSDPIPSYRFSEA